MLKILDDLEPFFQDNYRRIHVRMYARMKNISPPTASKILNNYSRNNLLIKNEDKGYLEFHSNNENPLFIQMQRTYYLDRFTKVGLINHIKQHYISPVILLFGSFAKAEISENSDIDLAIFSVTKKNLDLTRFEKKLGRSIQLFQFKDRKTCEKNPELLNNILNGFPLQGSW